MYFENMEKVRKTTSLDTNRCEDNITPVEWSARRDTPGG
jgi:hypothetical protein